MVFPIMDLAATARGIDQKTWYGPATATFPVQFSGNPYDPAENEVEVQFTNRKGRVEKRPAFFNPQIASWQSQLAAQEAGEYQARLIRNGQPSPIKNREGTIKLMASMVHGFIHPDPTHTNRFAWDDGTTITPIGFDLGWQDPKILSIPDQIAKMGHTGINWTRIWACSWDGKNPWWPSDKTKLEGRSLWPPALAQWERIEQACSAANVGLQFVLFHHGEFSSQVDPNWPGNPWNTANGGFLKKPGDFFTDPEAKRRAKIWLRYAVARYSASPAIFGWELFNEVQWVDPIHIDHRWDEVEAWHKEMADYVRSIDPYHHPVTTSSELRPNLNSSLDYVQPHTYPNNIFASVIGTEMPKGMPGFYGEFGPSNMAGADQRKAVLDGLLGGLLANHAGSGMYWFWDTVESKNLYSAFSVGRTVVDLAQWDRHPDAKLAEVTANTAAKSTFVFQPGLGWAKTTQFKFDLPTGASAMALGRVSGYIQGTSNRDMMAQPIEVRFNLAQISKMRIALGDVSTNGGSIEVKVDGASVSNKSYKHDDKPEPIELELRAGPHLVVLSNNGVDWVGLRSISIESLAPAVSIAALAEPNWMMARMTRNDKGSTSLHVDLDSLPLSPGSYTVTSVDLETGKSREFTVMVDGSKCGIDVSEPDQVLIFKRASS